MAVSAVSLETNFSKWHSQDFRQEEDKLFGGPRSHPKKTEKSPYSLNFLRAISNKVRTFLIEKYSDV